MHYTNFPCILHTYSITNNKTIMTEFEKNKSIEFDAQLNEIINQYPDDATCWSQATDEIRDLAYAVRCAYNECVLDVCEGDKGYVEALNFRSFTTPSQWNTNAKKQIRELWAKMTPWAKANAID